MFCDNSKTTYLKTKTVDTNARYYGDSSGRELWNETTRFSFAMTKCSQE